MGEITPFRRPINWTRVRTDEAERVIRSRSMPGTDNVVFTDHTWDRVSEREITRADVFDILRTGHCHDQPVLNEKGDWQVIVSKRIAGRREAGALTIMLEKNNLLIIRTVEWIDPK